MLRTTTTRHRRHSSTPPPPTPTARSLFDTPFAVPGMCTCGCSSADSRPLGVLRRSSNGRASIRSRRLGGGGGRNLHRLALPCLAFRLRHPHVWLLLGGGGARYYNEQTKLDAVSQMTMKLAVGFKVEKDGGFFPSIVAAPLGAGVETDPNFAKTEAGTVTVLVDFSFCCGGSSFVLWACWSECGRHLVLNKHHACPNLVCPLRHAHAHTHSIKGHLNSRAKRCCMRSTRATRS